MTVIALGCHWIRARAYSTTCRKPTLECRASAIRSTKYLMADAVPCISGDTQQSLCLNKELSKRDHRSEMIITQRMVHGAKQHVSADSGRLRRWHISMQEIGCQEPMIKERVYCLMI